MLINYLKIFLQLFFRQTIFTLVNVMSLAVGMACCLVIALFVRHELSFDRSFTNADNLYRVALISVDPAGVVSEGAAIFYPAAPLLAQNFAAISDISRMRPWPALIRNGEAAFFEDQFKLVDANFFRLFNVDWLEGNPETAFAEPTNVVLTQSLAEKYFGSESPMGRFLEMSEGITLTVAGVMEDLPDNTHLNGSIFASMALREILESIENRTVRQWYNESYHTYVSLQPGYEMEAFNRELVEFSKAYIPGSYITFTLTLDSIADIHLNPKIGDMKPPGSKLDIAVFTAIGFAILLIACINFVNLSTARSSQRFREVGLRLAFGARRLQLISQFLGESLLFIVLAITIAVTLVELLLPPMQVFLGLDFETRLDAPALAVLLCAVLALGLMAGWYPAMVLSGLKPVAALKNQAFTNVRRLVLKNLLIVIQFSIAIALIIASIVIHSQLRFARDLDLGFHRDQVLVIRTDDAGSGSRIKLLKEQVLENQGISSATVSNATPEKMQGATFVTTEGDETAHRLAYVLLDFDYFSVFDIKLLAGRYFREDMQSDLIRTAGDDTAAILNERGAREFGWTPDTAIGQLLSNNGHRYRVVGVVSNTIESAQAGINPAIYAIPAGLDPGRYLSLRLDGSRLAESLAFIDSTWKAINPEEPIISSFLDDSIQQQYRGEDNQMRLSFIFSAIAIVISCMGLFGLAAFNAERRAKEVGVRKVMGGSVWSIVLLLTNDFSRLVLLSNLIAWPVAYVAMNRWLENFAYRIDLTPLIFIGSGLIALCIAWVTVGGTAAKAASAKPVLALRYE